MNDDQFVRHVQAQLQARGLYSGKIDGDPGPVTMAALARALSNDPILSVPEPADLGVTYPTQAKMVDFYGAAGGKDCTAGTVVLPFEFPLAWDDSQKIKRFSCHTRVAQPLTSIFREAVAHYGETQFRELRLDRFGGCYNYRKMRNGSALSMHAWGVAVDLDPENNQLKWGRDKATFAKPDYDAWWKIVEDHGAVSLGRARNYDWMHFQFARLS